MTRRTRLLLCGLESRYAPGGFDPVPQLAGPGDGAAVKAAMNAAPVISNFRAIVGPNGQVTFTGRVSDDTAVTGYVVRITGPGVDLSAIVLRDGTFSVTTVVNGSTDMTVAALTTDSGGLKSDPAYTTFLPSG